MSTVYHTTTSIIEEQYLEVLGSSTSIRTFDFMRSELKTFSEQIVFEYKINGCLFIVYGIVSCIYSTPIANCILLISFSVFIKSLHFSWKQIQKFRIVFVSNITGFKKLLRLKARRINETKSTGSQLYLEMKRTKQLVRKWAESVTNMKNIIKPILFMEFTSVLSFTYQLFATAYAIQNQTIHLPQNIKQSINIDTYMLDMASQSRRLSGFLLVVALIFYHIQNNKEKTSELQSDCSRESSGVSDNFRETQLNITAKKFVERANRTDIESTVASTTLRTHTDKDQLAPLPDLQINDEPI